MGVNLIGIGISDRADKTQMEYITGNPKNVMVNPSGQDLEEIIPQLDQTVSEGNLLIDQSLPSVNKNKNITLWFLIFFQSTVLCVENDCENGGLCQKDGQTLKCQCDAGYSGPKCTGNSHYVGNKYIPKKARG